LEISLKHILVTGGTFKKKTNYSLFTVSCVYVTDIVLVSQNFGGSRKVGPFSHDTRLKQSMCDLNLSGSSAIQCSNAAMHPKYTTD